MMRKLICLQILLFLVCTIINAQTPQYPDNVDTADCTSMPPAKAFDIKLKWETVRYDKENDPHVNGCSTPLVADVDGDGFPEVIASHTTKSAGHGNTPKPNSFISRNLVVVNGKTGAFKYMLQTVFYQLHGQPIAIGDVDGDGKSEVFIVSDDYKVYCYKADKANASADDYKWIGHTTSNSTVVLNRMYIPMLADINNDGIVELVCGESIFNAITGVRILSGEMNVEGRGIGSPHNIHCQWQLNKKDVGKEYYLFALADMDGDKKLELCAGNTIYKLDITNPIGTNGNKWKELRKCERKLPYEGQYNIYDGQTFILDFDNDGDMDICVLARRSEVLQSSVFASGQNPLGLYVWDGQTTEMIGYFICDPKTFAQSIPFAGDLNGDGFPEIVFNGFCKGYHYNRNHQYSDHMHVYTFQKGYSLNSTDKAWNIKEVFPESKTKDFYSYSGFTVFDFNQDGKAELVYRDKKVLNILDGTTLEPLCEPKDCFSGTTAEYPVVADVDCDGHADIVVTGQYVFSPGEIEGTENDFTAGRVHVFESATPAAWGPARKVWNQWPYNVVNINEDNTIPKFQFDISTRFPNGSRPFNAFLQQATRLSNNGDMYAPATNAIIEQDTAALTVYCDSITIDITFTNKGTEALYAPYGLTIYKDEHVNGDVIYQKVYTQDLEVDDVVHLHLTYNEQDVAQWTPINDFVIAINDRGMGVSTAGGQQSECDTTDNILICHFDGFRKAEYDTVTHHMCEGDIYQVGESIYTESGTYIDTLTNQFGCDSIVTSYLHVHSISVDLGPDQRFCLKDFVPVTLDAGAEAAEYLWQDGSTNRTFVVNSEGGVFSVTVTDGYGCQDSDSVTITVIPNPELTITQEPEDFCENNRAVLTVTSSVEDALFEWNTGETSSSIEVTKHGVYTVEGDNQGCTSIASIKVPICPCEMWLPNAFTPNDDGLNDIFMPQITYTLNSYELVIYNRWGQQVFSTSDPTQGWDGTVKGQNSPSAVYYYVVNYACESTPDLQVMKHGSITLVR